MMEPSYPTSSDAGQRQEGPALRKGPSELIWITGASQGIGKALALAWARQGHTVVISARDAERLEQVCEQAQTFSGRIYPLACDITDRESVGQSLSHLLESEGLPDRVVLNAGTHKPFPAAEFSADTLKQLLEVNVLGAGYILEKLLPLYLQKDAVCKGQIALVASVAGYRGLPTASAYGATKAAMINMAESLHAELYGSGVDIRLINPGFVRTPLTDKNDFPMPFLIEAEDAAQRIIKGLNGRSFEIVFPRRMALAMSLLKWLPDRFFFPLINRTTGHS